MVTKDLFIVVLAALTVMSGVAMLIMFFRRRRERAEAALLDDLDASRLRLPVTAISHDTPPADARRPIDDYAIAVDLDGGDDDEDVGKICPSCGKRYRSHHRFCERDNSELAALN